MNAKHLIVALSALALLGAGCPSAPQAAAPNPEIESGGLVEGTVISMTGSGFSPSTLTVKKGTAVMFLNEDPSSSHWPASTPHPIHTDYPGFDARAPVAPGATYTFTFDRVGAWRYHDHLNPSRTGTIVVTE